MGFRYMRVMVFFDLPVLTKADQKSYRVFRKFLMKSGFIMMQESVYSKLTLNGVAAKTVRENVRKNSPKNGLVEMLTVTEKQFANMEILCGEDNSEYVTSTDRLIFI